MRLPSRGLRGSTAPISPVDHSSGRDELMLVRSFLDPIGTGEQPRMSSRFAMARPRCKAFRTGRACRDVAPRLRE
jgi:hypothetical protein